jgi:hypothetical protein
MQYYTPSAVLYCYEYDGLTDFTSEGELSVTYPNYTGIPFSQTIDLLISHSSTTASPTGVYSDTETVHDFWDYDFLTDTFKYIEVESYEFGVYDLSVVAP